MKTNNMNLSTVHFSELDNYNDSNSIVMMGIVLNNDDVESVCDFFNKTGIAPNGKNVTGIYKILDNVLGDNGRTDWLVTFDHQEDIQFNFIKRLGYADWIKWTSDFIDNYKNDYKV